MKNGEPRPQIVTLEEMQKQVAAIEAEYGEVILDEGMIGKEIREYVLAKANISGRTPYERNQIRMLLVLGIEHMKPASQKDIGKSNQEAKQLLGLK